MTKAIEVQGLTKVLATAEVETVAVNDVSFSIPAGEYAAITGTSGSGKSTLLSLLSLIEPATQGSVRLFGTEMSAATEADRARCRAESIGIVFQSFHLIPELSVLDNVRLKLRYLGTPVEQQREMAEGALRRVGLEARMGHFPSQLSGGQQQRAAIARAVVSGPKLIFADEPTGNLDTANAGRVADLLFELTAQTGAALVLVTHDEGLAGRADRVVRLRGGQVVERA